MTGALILNPGSGPVEESGDGWENTYAGAVANAERWLARLADEGIREVDMTAPAEAPSDEGGRWTFQYRHRITGKVVELSTHGIVREQWAAYEKDGGPLARIFGPPRVYWNGSSSEIVEIEAFAVIGWRICQTFEPDPAQAAALHAALAAVATKDPWITYGGDTPIVVCQGCGAQQRSRSQFRTSYPSDYYAVHPTDCSWIAARRALGHNLFPHAIRRGAPTDRSVIDGDFDGDGRYIGG